jgi:Tfp pilus assembly protein PilP
MMRERGHRTGWPTSTLCALTALLISALCFSLAAPSFGQTDQQKRQIRRPPELKTAKEIERFVMEVLSDRTKRQDPFIKAPRQQQTTIATYEISERPRPAAGFGRYDIDQLTLNAIWKGSDKVTAMFRAPDDKLFIVTVGDEAYDGRIIEISFEGKYVKFLRVLERVGPKVAGQPDVKYEPVLVRMRQ